MKSMNYGFGDDQVKSSGNPFPVGEKVDDVEITNCQYATGEDKRGVTWEAIDVTYTRAGSSIYDRMFAVNPDNITTRPWVTDDTHEDAVDDAVKTYNTQLLHIATKVGLSKEDLLACNSNTTFENFASDYCDLIMENCAGVKMYLKTVPGANGYTKVARTSSSSVPFLHRMGDGECTLKYTEKELKKVANATPPNGASMKDSKNESWIPSTSV